MQSGTTKIRPKLFQVMDWECLSYIKFLIFPFEQSASIYLFKLNNRNTIKRCEIYSKLTIKTPERQCRRFGVFILNFEHISSTSIVDFKQVNISWDLTK